MAKKRSLQVDAVHDDGQGEELEAMVDALEGTWHLELEEVRFCSWGLQGQTDVLQIALTRWTRCEWLCPGGHLAPGAAGGEPRAFSGGF